MRVRTDSQGSAGDPAGSSLTRVLLAFLVRKLTDLPRAHSRIHNDPKTLCPNPDGMTVAFADMQPALWVRLAASRTAAKTQAEVPLRLILSASTKRIVRFLARATAVGLACLVWPAQAGGSGPEATFAAQADRAESMVSEAAVKNPGEEPVWAEFLGTAWRLEFLRQHLTAPLFQSSEPLDAASAEVGSGPASVAGPPASAGRPEEPERLSCVQLRVQGDRFLAQGLLPEALTRYRSAETGDCPDAEALRIQIGLLKVNLAMSRFEEARGISERLAGRADPDTEPLLDLLSGVLALAAGEYGRAWELFNRWRPYWPRMPAIQVLAAYSGLCQGKAEETVPLFRACEDSPFRPVRDFATLGLAQALLAGGRSAEAGPLYEKIASGGSPAGLLGRAEYRIRSGDLAQAQGDLDILISGPANDYWKGVAYTYLLHLHLQRKQWRPALATAQKGRMLILGESWNRRLVEGAIQGIEQGIEDLAASANPAAVWLLAQEWKDYLPSLKADTRLRLARSFQGLGLRQAALDLYHENDGDPEAWLEAAKLAWEGDDLEAASAFCEKLLALPDAPLKSEAKWLLGCLRFRQGLQDQARTLLAEAGTCQDPGLLAEGGRAALAMGMTDWGIEQMKKAAASQDLDPRERAHVVQELAEARYRLKQCEEAYQAPDEIVPESHGSEAQVSLWKVLCLSQSGKTAEARRVSKHLPPGPDRVRTEEILRADETIAEMEKGSNGP